MIEYREGNNLILKGTIQSIVDIHFSGGVCLSVFPGRLSPNDILLRYKEEAGTGRFRTPKHIHWVIDLLLKRERNEHVTNAFLERFQRHWEEISSLANRDYETIVNSVLLARDEQFLKEMTPLNTVGYYRIDFVAHLMELLMIQEKTNYAEAYMFITVIEELLLGTDLYALISKATHVSRKR